MWESITFIYWHRVTHTIPRIQHNTCRSTTGIQGENSLDGNIHCWHIEGLKHDLSHLLPVCLRVKGGLSQKHWMFLRSNTKLIIECVMPDLFHVIPIANYTMFNGVFQTQNTSLRLCFITYIGILLTHSNHYPSVSRSAHNTGEHCSRSIITSKSSLHHSSSIVTNKRLNILCVSHFPKTYTQKKNMNVKRERLSQMR
uniref:Actin n=1 Tax=Rhizophora mucronata TaxID=61149 RepID=A0A2P2MF41_RHIMU